MVRIIMSGCNGRMGQVISGIVEADSDAQIVAGVDIFTEKKNSYPVYKSIDEVKEEADVVIDFSNPSNLDSLLAAGEAKGLALVLCTTGYSKEQLDKINEAAKKTAVLRSANMSVGVNVLFKLVAEATKVLSERGYDIDIVEEHHRNKLDAPSGTAIAIADAINEAANNKYEYVYDRSSRREKRPDNEIGISSVRGGSIVGVHDAIFAGLDEVIEIKHTAYSRAIFGKGAVAAAKYLLGKGAGMYSMQDVIA
ncbi:MAG TPA: 4-hydroxy-tetrahydrodipicolinate reductase [Lachnospiraceae bacterium]|nr:4-hydroxy-tetrahydrodipicolinate reductase [Lachnospiraceae bacterium]HBR04370.1 4-hydroxy-tetrahydrodipicolinate reductase [Lachnospiraceae bacterium]